MNWNVAPGHAAVRPAHPESQPAAFLEQALRTSLTAAPPSSLGPLGTGQEACVFLGHADPAPRPLVSVRSYKATQQLLPLPDMPGEIVVASQTSVGRVTYASVKGPRPLLHGFQAAPTLAQSTWPSVPGTCPTLAPSGAPSTRGLQGGQYPSSDGYSVPLQMAPPGSGRAPGTYPGAPRCPPSQPPPGDWTQQLASSGPSYAEHRPLPQQCSYASRGFLREPAAQGHDPGPLPPPPAKNCHPLGPAPVYEPKVIYEPKAPAASYPCPAPPAGKGPPPPYECSFSRPPPPGPPPAARHAALDGPQGQERPPEPRRAFGPDLQPPWRDVAEAAGGLGGLRGLEAPADPGRPFADPGRPFADPGLAAGPGCVRNLAPSRPEKGADACSPPAAQVLDARATKEKLVRDIKTLVEIKRKFAELARKIKINKDLLLAAGCIKAGGASSQEPAQRPGPALGKPGPGPGPVPWVAPGPVEPPTPPAAVDSGPHGGGWSGLEALFRLSPEKPAPLPRQDSPRAPGPLRPAAGPLPPAAALGGPCPSGSPGGAERHAPAGAAIAPAAPHAPAACLEGPAARPPHKHPLEYPITLSLLEAGSAAAQPGAPQGAGQALPADPGAQLAGHGGPRAAAAQPPCRVAATLPADRSPLRGAPGRAGAAGQEGRCSVEVLATCLSLWKKLPAEGRPLPGPARPADAHRPGAPPTPGVPETKTAPGAPAAAPFPAAQSHEPPSAPAARAPELQIAVVPPLVLSDARALPAKEEPPGPPPEALYPTIEEGSVCSLRSPLAAELQDAAALKGAEAGAPGHAPDAAAELEPESASPAPPAPGEALRIGSICSLVEGDVAYDWQIARIFSTPPREGADPGLRKDGGEADAGASGASAEAAGPAPPPRPPGASSQPAPVDAGAQPAGDATPGRAPGPSAAPQQLGHPPESGGDAAQAAAGGGAPGESAPAAFLHGQLAALLREFPYGIEAGAAGGGKAAGEPADPADPGDPAGQIHITVLSAEQMKALFPEQDDPPPGPDGGPEPLPETLPETPASGEGDPGTPQPPSGHGGGPNPVPDPIIVPDPVLVPDPDPVPDPVIVLDPDPGPSPDPNPGPSPDPNPIIPGPDPVPDPDPILDPDPVAVDAGKDDVGCCALGWLSAVYTGLSLPQCRCQCQSPQLPAPETAARAAERVPPAKARGRTGSPPEAPPAPADRKAAPSAVVPGRPAQEKPKAKPVDAWRPEPKASGRGDRKRDGSGSHRASKERTLPEADRASQEQRPPAPAPAPLLGQARGAPARDAKGPQARPPAAAAPQVLGPPRAWTGAAGGPDARLWHKRKPDEAASRGPGLKRRKQELAQRPGGPPARPGPPAPSERSRAKGEPGPSVRAPGPGEGPVQGSRPVPPGGVQQPRHKDKDAAGPKAKHVTSRLWDPQAMRPGKLAPRLGGGGKPPTRDPPSGGPGSGPGPSKHPRAPLPAEPEASAMKSVKGVHGGRPPDGVWTDKSKVDGAGRAGAEAGAGPAAAAAPGQAPVRPQDAMKRYLNRVAFRCEREGISLTRLDGSPRKLGRDEERPDTATAAARGLLEFKLCPEGMIRGAGPAHPLRDPKPRPQKEQAPMQVSGIRSTKADWLRCASEEGRAPGASEDTARSAPAHPRLSKRSLSADGFDAAQTPVRDSTAMFQTYKKMYLEKRSRSLGSSPVK